MVDISSLHNRKVAIIGTGNVGASIAYALTIRNFAREIVLIDKITERAAGEALDIQHGIPYMGISSVRAGDYSDCADCDLVVITAGRNRNVGETRLDLARDNVEITESVVASIKPYFNRGVILMVANPVDVLTYRCTDLMGLPDGRVFGTGNILDSSRLVRLVSDYTGLKGKTHYGIATCVCYIADAILN